MQADVNVQIVLELTKRIEKRALEEKLPPGMARKEQVIKIVYEELGREDDDFLHLPKAPALPKGYTFLPLRLHYLIQIAMMHLRMGDKEFARMEDLAQYCYETGRIKSPNRSELLRYALNVLDGAIKEEIYKRRYGR